MFESILAIATLVGGWAAIDYFCREYEWCKKFKSQEPKVVNWNEGSVGPIPLNSPLYIERFFKESEYYHQSILGPHTLIRVKAPTSMGKTSSVLRIIECARKEKHRIVYLSFNEIDMNLFKNSDLDQFLKQFCELITEKLNLSKDKLLSYWQSKEGGSKQKCTNYFIEYLLKGKFKSPLVLALDDVDIIFQSEMAEDFFLMLRTWNESSKRIKILTKLKIVIAHSVDILFSQNIRFSFNIGICTELKELSQEQIGNLAKQYDLYLTEKQTKQLSEVIDGHPYLIQTAFREIASGRKTLEQFLESVRIDNGPYNDHLQNHLLDLEKHEDILQTFRKIVLAINPLDIRSEKINKLHVYKLHSMGLVKIQYQGKIGIVMPTCGLYQRYFAAYLTQKKFNFFDFF